MTALPDCFDIVFDAAGTLSTRDWLGLLAADGRFCTVEPTLGGFALALVNHRLKPLTATPRHQ